MNKFEKLAIALVVSAIICTGISIFSYSYTAGTPGAQVLLAKRDNPEKYYQALFCLQVDGTIEYRLQDGTRVDCLTCDHAIEHDFANKWAEAIGQALYYASQTDRIAGIALILEDPAKDWKYVERVIDTINYHCLDIVLWTMTVKGGGDVLIERVPMGTD